MPTASTKPFTPLARPIIVAARQRYEQGEAVAAIAAALKIGVRTISNYAKKEGWTRPDAPGPEKIARASVASTTKTKTRKPPPRSARPAGAGKATQRKPGAKAGVVKTSARKSGANAKSSRKTVIAPRAMKPNNDENNSCAAGETESSFDSGRQLALVDRIWRVAEKQVAAIERRIGVDKSGSSERDARALAVMTRMLRELASLNGDAQRGQETAAAAEMDDDAFDREVDDYCAKITRILESMHARGNDAAPVDQGNVASDHAADGDALVVSGEGGSVSA